MKAQNSQRWLTVLGMMLAINTHAYDFASLDVSRLDLNNLELTAKDIQQCSKKPSATFQQVRELIARQQYAEALTQLDSSAAKASDEQLYLRGKINYLLAHQTNHADLQLQPAEKYLAIAEKLITSAANAGYAEAIYDQAMLFTSPAATSDRLVLLKKAAAKKFIPAMLTLADETFISAITFEQRVEAQSLLQTAASLDTQAQLRLANLYLHEDEQLKNLTGYSKDTDKAIYLLYDAAKRCSADAALKLSMLANNLHKPNRLDNSRELYWLESSAKLGSAEAQGRIAQYYFEARDLTQALKWAEQGAANDNLKSLLILAKIYYSEHETEKDHTKALKYYEKALAVDKSNRVVQNQLGMMYYRGEGGEPDFRRAANLCKQAANKGQAGCQYYLGLMYVNGEGVAQDIDTGIRWMKKSAAQDYTTAKNWLRENW